MATVPLSGTNVRILSSVPFSNDYKNTRWFDNITSQTNWFLAKPTTHTATEHNFQRIEGQMFISVNKSIDELWGSNYLMFQNAQYNNKWFYAFVTKLEYKQKMTTYVHFQIDVLQTWKFEMDFKPSFVVREHCKLWNADGTPVINTVDEGLNYGSEYDNIHVQQIQPNGGYKWLVIVTKTPIHASSAVEITPTVIGTPQPLSVYITPFKDDGTFPNVVLPNGSGHLTSSPIDILGHIYKDVEAVNNVVSLYVTDYTGLVTSYDSGSNTITFPAGNTLKSVQISDGEASPTFFNAIYVEEVKNFGVHTEDVGAKYSGYRTVTESKLLMHPYTQLILDDFKGNRVAYKNEYINGTQLLLNVKGSMGTSNKTSYGFADYNYGYNGTLENELGDEFALINNEPNDIPIVADMLSAYLQGNRNSLQNQKNSIVFNGIFGSLGAGVGASASAMALNPLGIAAGGINFVQGMGNMALQLEGLEAKQKDISNMPPQMVKMGNNTSYTMGNDYNGVFVIKKQIKPEYIKKLEHFFNMFGYKVHEIKIPNFHTRQNWNYVQTNGCNIIGNFNNEDLQELKSVFDNGITLWHTDDVGNYALGNGVL
jgi:hypothetical protein